MPYVSRYLENFEKKQLSSFELHYREDLDPEIAFLKMQETLKNQTASTKNKFTGESSFGANERDQTSFDDDLREETTIF